MKRTKMSRVISFRVTEKDWFEIERAATERGDKPHEWCRMITLETLRLPEGLTPNQRLLFGNFARIRFLVENGFQLLADDTLESEEWKRFRAFARANLDVITDRALADLRSGTDAGPASRRWQVKMLFPLRADHSTLRQSIDHSLN